MEAGLVLVGAEVFGGKVEAVVARLELVIAVRDATVEADALLEAAVTVDAERTTIAAGVEAPRTGTLAELDVGTANTLDILLAGGAIEVLEGFALLDCGRDGLLVMPVASPPNVLTLVVATGRGPGAAPMVG